MALDNEAKRWGMMQAASGPAMPNFINPDGSDFDSETERLTLLNLYGGILEGTSLPVAATTGTAINVAEAVIVSTGGTVIITLTNDTYIAAGTGPIGTLAESDAFVQALLAATSPTNGWNNEVAASLTNTDLVRTDNETATITIPATAAYAPGATETITPVIQAAILTTSAIDVNSSIFQITAVGDENPGLIPQAIPDSIPQNIPITIG